MLSAVCFEMDRSKILSYGNGLRKEGTWFDRQLGQYFFRGLMIVNATGFIPLSSLSVVSTMVMWESSQWLGKNSM